MAKETSSSRGPMGEAIGSIVTVVLAILGLAHVAPSFLIAIATIAFGAALLMHGSAMLGDYARLASEMSGNNSAALGGGGLSAILLAGAGGVILGILALLGISLVELTAIAVIAYGSALILSSNSALRLHLFKFAAAQPDARAQRATSDFLASEMLSSSAGIYGLTGLAAIVLGILALAGFSAVILVLIALLALGAVNIVNGIDATGLLVTTLRRAIDGP
jgi:hypothetical protein